MRKPIGKWTLDEATKYCANRRKMVDGSSCEHSGCELFNRGICNEWIHEWNTRRFTDEEIELAKAIMVVFPSAKTIRYDRNRGEFVIEGEQFTRFAVIEKSRFCDLLTDMYDGDRTSIEEIIKSRE